MVILAKTGKRVSYSDEVESTVDLTAQIKEARRVTEEEEDEEDDEKEDADSQEVRVYSISVLRHLSLW